MWGCNTLKGDDFTIPPSLPLPPVWRVASVFFRRNLALTHIITSQKKKKAWGGPSSRRGTAKPVGCNGKSQETWGTATCAVWPSARPLTPLCLTALIGGMG